MKKCITQNCDNTISPNSHFDDCPNCRASIGAWSRRSPADVLQRRKNLEKYRDRMQNVSSPAKVVALRKKKAVPAKKQSNVVPFRKKA